MKKTQENLTLLNIIFVVSLIVANVVTGKLIDTGVTLFNTPVILPGAAVCYAITFLMTDVIGEIWGREEANKCVKLGFISQILATMLILFTRYIPAYQPEVQNAYNLILGQNYIFVIGSLVAYYCSQSWDVFIFHQIRNKVVKLTGSNKHRWIWNNISTMTSQIIDTFVFITICFGIGYGWLLDISMIKVFIVMIIAQYVFKFILATLDTPLFYLMTQQKEGETV